MIGGSGVGLDTSKLYILHKLISDHDGARVSVKCWVISIGFGTSGSPAAARAILCRRCCSLSGTAGANAAEEGCCNCDEGLLVGAPTILLRSFPFGLPVGVGGFAVGASCDAAFGADGSADGCALATILLKSFPFLLPGDDSLLAVVAGGGAAGVEEAAGGGAGAAGGGGADIRDKSLPLPLPPAEVAGAGAGVGALLPGAGAGG